MDIKELRQQKVELIKEGREVLDKAKKEERNLSDKEYERFKEIDQKLDDIDAHIEREERQMDLERALASQPDDNEAQDQRNRPTSEQRIYGDLGSFLADIALASSPDGNQRAAANLRAATGMGETVGSDGGFLVQQDFSSELLKRTYEFGEISSRVRKVTVSGNGLKINAVDETSRANGSRWGGVLVYWADEAEAVTAKKPKLRQIELNLKKMFGLAYATEELLEDADALESIYSQAFTEEMNFKLEDGIINGIGGGQMLGIMNSAAVVEVAKETGQAANSIKYENINNMWSRMWSRSRRNAVWLINQDCEPQLDTMSVPVGTGGVPVYLPPGGASATPYATLKGRPVIPVEYCATVGTAGDIILADLSQYIMIDKGGIKANSSMHVRFIYDEMTFKFTYRADGQPIWNSALTPKNGSNTLSPYVTLATRA